MLNKFLEDVQSEVNRARAKFPGTKHVLPALMEEVGELAQAFLDHSYGKDTPEHIYQEAVQAAAMAMRCAEEGDTTFDYKGLPAPPKEKV